MSRAIACVLMAWLALLAVAATGSNAAAPKPVVQQLQHRAVERCPIARAKHVKPAAVKVVRQNVVVRKGRPHALRHGRPLVSHTPGACAPRAPPRVDVRGVLTNNLERASVLIGGQRGFDLSNNDPSYEWGPFRRAGLTFAWVKVTEGTAFHDRTAIGMRAAADRAGVVIGGYDFGHVCLVSAVQEASFFVSELRADGLNGASRLRPVLDAEYGGAGCSVQAWVQTWIDTMHRNGFRDLAIYTGCWWWHYGWPAPEVSAWVSGYPHAVACGHPITVHQDTDAAHVPGIGFGFDGNVLLGRPDEVTSAQAIPNEIASLNKEAIKFWDRRASKGHLDDYGNSRLDFVYNRIYQLGWSPHRSGPQHDWTLADKASKWAQDDCGKVVHKWDHNQHGAYVQGLLKHLWAAEHDRCHGRGWPGANGWRLVIRLPGNVNPQGVRSNGPS